MSKEKARNVGELKQSEYKVLSVKEELRKNLIRKISKGEKLFSDIIGYEETVIPQLENAILAGHDIIFLGERGQAKTRIIRELTSLLDEEVPCIEGCEINDNPFKPICKNCRSRLEAEGDKLHIIWLPREARYGEKLATPDTTIADLIGEVDPIRVAEGRYLSDELTIHYGLVPRTNRGIFCINELPDLAERIQVGLFNILEERDIQIRGYKIRLPLDVYLVASANPEDYTSRGRIITPLKDRYGSQIRTHYPRTMEEEISIVELEKTRYEDSGFTADAPIFMKEIVAEFSALARKSPDVNQKSGVSVRLTICNYEVMIGNAMRRAVKLGEKRAVARISDLPALVASTTGKIELESIEEGTGGRVIETLLQKAVLNVFNRRFSVQEFTDLIQRFEGGLKVDVSEDIASKNYLGLAEVLGGLVPALERLGIGKEPAELASGVEFILEGLHLNRRLNKERQGVKSVYGVH
ncbi:MAG: magnesium chelatase [Dehalococcoidia bacterium]|nr:magnesium chelatase [Dehalococcoidia bacterium]